MGLILTCMDNDNTPLSVWTYPPFPTPNSNSCSHIDTHTSTHSQTRTHTDIRAFLHASSDVPQWGLPTKQVSTELCKSLHPALLALLGNGRRFKWRYIDTAALALSEEVLASFLLTLSGQEGGSTCRLVAPSLWSIRSWRSRSTMTKCLLETSLALWPLSQGMCGVAS